MKKFLILLTVVSMLLCSCVGGSDGALSDTVGESVETTKAEQTTSEPEETSNEPETTAESALKLADFSIITPGDSTASEMIMFTRFKVALQNRTGLTFKSSYDDAVAANDGKCEILLGDTNRKQSAQALEKLEGKGYVLCVIDNKLVINANSDTALEQGITYCLSLFDSKDETIERTLSVVEKVDYDSLNGLKIQALGDSYFGGHTAGKQATWLYMLSQKYGMTLDNQGINGSTVANVADKNPMCERYSAMADGSDIILVEGGRNDYNQNVPLGTVDSRDTSTFAGALNTIFDGLKAENPNALILGITSWYVNSNMKAYSDMMIKVCEKQGIPVFNAADKDLSGVDMSDAGFRKAYCLGPNDVSHLNDAGMKLVLPRFEKFIGDAYNAYKTK